MPKNGAKSHDFFIEWEDIFLFLTKIFMIMTTLDNINKFFDTEKIAIAGVSRDHRKFGRVVFQELKSKGLKPIPINPNIDAIDEEVCYKDVHAIPQDVESLLIITPKDKTKDILENAIQKGIKNIWIQQKSENAEVLSMIKSTGSNVITGQCILMFADPKGIHKFHRTIKGFFGQLPK
jgi:predicted CoA-binding protein